VPAQNKKTARGFLCKENLNDFGDAGEPEGSPAGFGLLQLESVPPDFSRRCPSWPPSLPESVSLRVNGFLRLRNR